MFTVVVAVVWITTIPIVESLRIRLYEYQDFSAVPTCSPDALHLRFKAA